MGHILNGGAAHEGAPRESGLSGEGVAGGTADCGSAGQGFKSLSPDSPRKATSLPEGVVHRQPCDCPRCVPSIPREDADTNMADVFAVLEGTEPRTTPLSDPHLTGLIQRYHAVRLRDSMLAIAAADALIAYLESGGGTK